MLLHIPVDQRRAALKGLVVTAKLLAQPPEPPLNLKNQESHSQGLVTIQRPKSWLQEELIYRFHHPDSKSQLILSKGFFLWHWYPQKHLLTFICMWSWAQYKVIFYLTYILQQQLIYYSLLHSNKQWVNLYHIQNRGQSQEPAGRDFTRG